MQCPKISVIVPVYKVEKYLERCVDSIIRQTYKNLEIILVDDGSPDLCPDMCEEYAKKDSRIIVVHKENGGASDAKNAGLNVATGEYIGFVDSDDYIDLDMYNLLMQRLLEDQSDMIVCDYIPIDEDYRELRNKTLAIQDECLTANEAIQYLIRFGGCYLVPWNKLYKKFLFDSLIYPYGKKYEDAFVIHHILYRCKKVSHINKPLYFYMQRNGSIMSESNSVKDMDYGDAMIDQYYFAKSVHNMELKYYCVKRLSYAMENWKNYSNLDNECKKKYNELRKKTRFLLYEKGAWDSYSMRGRLFMRLQLLIPSVSKLLRK